jgi:hypothetical protein
MSSAYEKLIYRESIAQNCKGVSLICNLTFHIYGSLQIAAQDQLQAPNCVSGKACRVTFKVLFCKIIKSSF